MLGTIISISSNSWIGAWIGLEINLISFIPLIIDTNNSLSTEATLKYFLTQALASASFLFSIIILLLIENLNITLTINFNSILIIIINSSLLLKRGAAPFHFWFPKVMEGLSWINNLILITWQKIAPLILISYLLINNFIIIIIILSIIIGSIGGLNQTSLQKIIAFSSINHLGWILAAIILSENLWIIYFYIYSILSITITFLFNTFKIFHINQFFSRFINSFYLKFFILIPLLSLGGLPPFLGFLPKWLVIQSITLNNQYFIIFLIVCITLLTLFYYLRICYSSFIINYWTTNWNYNQFHLNFNIKISILFAFISIFGLSLFNLILTI